MSCVARHHREPLLAIDLFRFGLDTIEIADRLGITEADALKQMTIQRSRKRHLGNPYITSWLSSPSAEDRPGEQQ